MTWNELSQAIRDNPQPCLVLGSDGRPDKRCKIVASQAHHVLFGRDKRFKAWLDNPLNAQPACDACNAGTKIADNWTNARMHFESMVRNPSLKKRLIDWLENAPPKKKLSDKWKYYWTHVSGLERS